MNDQNVYKKTSFGQDQGVSGVTIEQDGLGRVLKTLRISLTDRCNFRCTYCMPHEIFGPDYAFMPQKSMLSFDEIIRLAGIFATMGVTTIRLTGGEPLLRTKIEVLIQRLAEIKGINDIALTTNGSLLSKAKAQALADAGLNRITISLDALDDATFKGINGVNFPVANVLSAIANADEAGFSPIKINMVVKRGTNEQWVLPMAEYFRGTGHVVRFIEYMDVGTSNKWAIGDVVTAEEIVNRIGERFPLQLIESQTTDMVATRYRYVDGSGEIGVIASVTKPFCAGCSRLRLTADGQIYTCLFASHGHDIRTYLRKGATDQELTAMLAGIWHVRTDRYSETRLESHARQQDRAEMSRLGG